MSLLPVIYNSLIIFSAVLFLVISLSYISFKMKGKNTPPSYSPHAAYIPSYNPKIIVAQNHKNAPPISIISMDRHENSIKSLNKEQYFENRTPKQYDRTKPAHYIDDVKSSGSSPYNSFNRTAKRIEIMNTSDKYGSHHISAKSGFNKKSHTFSDNAIFDFYYDRNDSKFVSLTSTKVG